MHLLLHIGTEKTGTTSIQSYLSEKSAELSRSGFYYCSSLGRPNNIEFSVASMDVEMSDYFLRQRNILTAEEQVHFRQKTRLALEQDIATARMQGCHSFVISNEHCHSRLTSVESVTMAKALLDGLFHDTTVVVVLRPQADLALSALSTYGRVERVDRSFFEKATEDNPFYNYATLIDRWSGVFDKAQIKIIPFRKSSDIVSDFCASIGLSTSEDTKNYRQNEALDIYTLAILNATERKRTMVAGRITRNALPFLDNLPVLEKPRISSEMAKSIQARFKRSNAELIDRWQQIDHGDLEPDWNRFGDDDNLDILTSLDALSPQISTMVEHFSVDSWLDQASLHLARSQRAAARGNWDNAMLFVEKAELMAQLCSTSTVRRVRYDRFVKELAQHKASLTHG